MYIRKCLLDFVMAFAVFSVIGLCSVVANAKFVPSLTLVGIGSNWCEVADNGPDDLDPDLFVIKCLFDKTENGISYKGTAISKSEKDFAQITLTNLVIKNAGQDVKPLNLRSYLDYSFDQGVGILWASLDGNRVGGNDPIDYVSNKAEATTFDSNPATALWHKPGDDNIKNFFVRHGQYSMGIGELSLVVTGNIGPNESYIFPDSLIATAVVPEPSVVFLGASVSSIVLSCGWRRRKRAR